MSATDSSGAASGAAPQPGPPDPAEIFDAINAHQKSAALRGAIELELFTAIAEGANTTEAIASRCQASERGVRILSDYLTVNGLLTKEDGQYGLTTNSAVFLDKNSSAYIGTAVRFLHSPDFLNAFQNVADLVRRGTTLLGRGGTVESDYDGWVEFARSMAPLMGPASEFIGELAVKDGPAKPRILDVAAGHGLFGISAARRNPGARIVALDWEKVLAVAKENAEAAGVLDRYELLPGDALTIGYGQGFDVVLATNFFHHFDQPACESLMRKMHACLNDGGRVVTLEFIPNEDRVSPPISATFSMMMLGTTPSGDAYTFAEYDKMFQAAGFARNELLDMPRPPQQAVVSYR